MHKDIDTSMYRWFINVWSHNIPVFGPTIDQKVADMAFLLGREDSQGGSGSLQRFKERHEIAGKAVTGESQAVGI